jgi:hypothetical protein
MRQPTAVTESIGDDPAKLIEAFVETVCNVGKAASFSILYSSKRINPATEGSPSVHPVCRQPFPQTRQNKHVKINEDQMCDCHG